MDFDAIVLGTGLSESIVAAALSKAGYKVAHIDTNPYYGGDQASLTIDELAEWADLRSSASNGSGQSSSEYFANQKARYTSISRSQSIPPQSRQYSISLAPAIVPSVGAHIDALIASGVSRYGQFKLLEKVAVYDSPGLVQSVPGSKEDVFKSKALSLVDKRRLMRFLMFAAGEFEGKKELEGKEQMPFAQFLREVFSLNDKAAIAIAYALAFCTSSEDPTLPAIQRTRQYLRSAGRYGTSPFLVGHYGGLGETAQGFCRTSAVKGGTYILGRRITGVHPPDLTPDNPPKDAASASAAPSYSVQLEDFEEQLTARILVSSLDYVPASLHATSSQDAGPSSSLQTFARCIAIIDKPLVFTPTEVPEELASAEDEGFTEDLENVPSSRPALPSYDVDTALLVFPPGALDGGSTETAAHVLVTGEGSMSAPNGKFIVNISLPLSNSSSSTAEDLLRPYLDAALTFTVPPPSAPEELESPATPLFTLFYLHHANPSNMSSDKAAGSSGIIVSPQSAQLLPVIADAATQNAEAVFWKAVQQLKAAGVKRPVPPKESAEKNEGEGEEETEDVDAFWPPLDAVEDESTDEW